MTDLIARLRHMAKLCAYGGLNDLLNEAAEALSPEPAPQPTAGEELERLRLENWQLRQACGYPIPADKETVNNPFRCGMCDARNREAAAQGGEWQAVLREARQYVRDAGCDEDPEAGRHSCELLDKIEAVLQERDDYKADTLRLHNEKMDFFDRVVDLEAAVARKDEALRAIKSRSLNRQIREMAKAALEDAPAPAEQEK